MTVLPFFSADSRAGAGPSRAISHVETRPQGQSPLGNPVSPQLLVSVRSPEETRTALRAAVPLIDIKEPSRGSLGCADAQTITNIAAIVREDSSDVSLSVALGELNEWERTPSIPQLPAGVHFVKTGLAHFRESKSWPARWERLRQRFEDRAQAPFRWIAVHYVDAAANSPDWKSILTATIDSGAAGLLLDTFSKDSGSLRSHISDHDLLAIRDATRRANLLLALAGGLRLQDLPQIAGIRPNIIAVRGAVCHGHIRTDTIDEQAIRNWIARLDQLAPSSRQSSPSL